MRILALVPGGVGDQILFFPTLEDLKKSYPNAKIDIIVEPAALAAYRVNKYFHDKSVKVLTFDFNARNGLADWSNLLGMMRDVEYDAVLCLGQIPTIGPLLWLTGIPQRIGYKESGISFLTNSFTLKKDQYQAAMYHDLLQGLGITTPWTLPTVTLLKEDIAWAEKQQQRQGIKNTGYILLDGSCPQGNPDKIYPINKWQKIIKEIQQRQPQLPVVAIQSLEQREFADELLAVCSGVKVISPDNIGELAAMIAGANLILCTENASMQLAVAVQTYTIALLGPTEPQKLLPSSDKYVGIKSNNGKVSTIAPETVLQKIWGET